MNTKKKNKKKWTKPKLVDLQVKRTEGGKGRGFYEDTHYVPGQGGMS